MYVEAERAMNHRRNVESPSWPAIVMQHPDLTRMGRLTGGPRVTLGALGQSDSVLTTSGVFGIPWMDIALIGGVLIGGALLLKYVRGGGGADAAPRRRRRRFKLPKIGLPTVALLGALAYFYAKSQSGS